MTRVLILAAVAILLVGCAAKPEPQIQTVTVNVPVPVACIPDDLLPPPQYPDTDATLRAAPELADFEKLLYAGRQLRDKRLEALESVVENCRLIPNPTKAFGSGPFQ
jgi:hypothetical protein